MHIQDLNSYKYVNANMFKVIFIFSKLGVRVGFVIFGFEGGLSKLRRWARLVFPKPFLFF
jgi:hypothetical protein